MDLPNNADIVLSPALNLQVGLSTIHNYLCCIHGRLVHVDETSTDLQILNCELHKNAFGGRAPPGPAGGAIALLQTPNRYTGERREGRERKGLEIVGRGGREGHEGVGREGKGREDENGREAKDREREEGERG